MAVGEASRPDRTDEGGCMGKTSLAVKGVILMIVMFAFLKFGVPLFTAPLPMSLTWLYLFLTACGIVVYGTLTGESIESLFRPVLRCLGGERLPRRGQSFRLVGLALLPRWFGRMTYDVW